jgi:hypothetical protein
MTKAQKNVMAAERKLAKVYAEMYGYFCNKREAMKTPAYTAALAALKAAKKEAA